MKILIGLLLLISTIGMSQDTTITYSEVVQVPDVNKEQLYLRARLWTASIFKDAKEVIQIEDKESGEIAGKGIVKPIATYRSMGKDWETEVITSFMFRVLVKDGRYKYEINRIENIYDRGVGSSQTTDAYLIKDFNTADIAPWKIAMVSQKKTNEWYIEKKRAISEAMLLLITSLKTSMSKSADDF